MPGAAGRGSVATSLETAFERGLHDALASALRRARASGAPVIASRTAVLAGPHDPSAIAVASRRPGEHWFCLEQPDRHGWALAALGSVRVLEARGADRFVQVARRWRALSASAVADWSEDPPGSGLVALGGFAFAPDGGDGPGWEGFAPASLVVPEVSLSRRKGRTALTLNVEAAPDDTLADLAPAGIAAAGRAAQRTAAAARPRARRGLPGPEPDAAVALRGGRGAGGRADPGWRAREGRLGA